MATRMWTDEITFGICIPLHRHIAVDIQFTTILDSVRYPAPYPYHLRIGNITPQQGHKTTFLTTRDDDRIGQAKPTAEPICPDYTNLSVLLYRCANAAPSLPAGKRNVPDIERLLSLGSYYRTMYVKLCPTAAQRGVSSGDNGMWQPSAYPADGRIVQMVARNKRRGANMMSKRGRCPGEARTTVSCAAVKPEVHCTEHRANAGQALDRRWSRCYVGYVGRDTVHGTQIKTARGLRRQNCEAAEARYIPTLVHVTPGSATEPHHTTRSKTKTVTVTVQGCVLERAAVLGNHIQSRIPPLSRLLTTVCNRARPMTSEIQQAGTMWQRVLLLLVAVLCVVSSAARHRSSQTPDPEPARLVRREQPAIASLHFQTSSTCFAYSSTLPN
ncbi:hypothetical protein CHU98_g4090 [Xylaria longipes]|nr:hypothetical protein CHU98_g4090 [Xylaria longipes]